MNVPQPGLDSGHAKSAPIFEGQDIPSRLATLARERGDQPFLIWEPRSGRSEQWTYGQFWQQVRRVAAELHARGICPGDRLLLHSDNCPEMIIAWYATATLGAMAVTTNTASTASELAYFASQAGVRAAITQPAYAELITEHAGRLDWIAVTRDNSGEPAQAGSSYGESFDRLLDADPEALPKRQPHPLLAAGIVYTSGTTSRPKAVLHSHANFLWAGHVGARVLGLAAHDRHMAYMPLFHTNSQLWSTAAVLGAGASIVLLPRVTVRGYWDVVVKHGVTHSTMMPLIERAIAADPVPRGHRLKRLNAGRAPKAFAARCGCEAVAAYGMSETVTYTLHTDTARDWPADSIGRPAPGYEMMLVQPDTQEPCGPDEQGELWVRGTRGVQLFLEYYNDPVATANAFTPDGWFRTGDIMRRDEQGQYYFCDRSKDRLKVGGENVSAHEVEVVVSQVPGVAEVAVVGQPEPALGEVPVAFVLRTANASEEDVTVAIHAHCEQALSRFKRPRAVYFLADLPRAALGKIAKQRLRELASAKVS